MPFFWYGVLPDVEPSYRNCRRNCPRGSGHQFGREEWDENKKCVCRSHVNGMQLTWISGSLACSNFTGCWAVVSESFRQQHRWDLEEEAGKLEFRNKVKMIKAGSGYPGPRYSSPFHVII